MLGRINFTPSIVTTKCRNDFLVWAYQIKLVKLTVKKNLFSLTIIHKNWQTLSEEKLINLEDLTVKIERFKAEMAHRKPVEFFETSDRKTVQHFIRERSALR